LEAKFPKQRIHAALEKTKVVVRGPKPLSVCKINNIPVSVTVPEPNTWHEILTILSDEGLIAGRRVAVLEYGVSNREFLEELRARGATVRPTRVYQWALPEDLAPLRQAIDETIAGRVDALLLTNAAQIHEFLQVAGERELALRRALHRVMVASIGPTTSEALRERQIFPDLEASPNKMADLVEQAAPAFPDIAQQKRARTEAAWVRVEAGQSMESLPESPMLKACRREATDRIPIWLMRQAGRYMAEYQSVRGGVDFLTLCKRPELAAQVTLDA